MGRVRRRKDLLEKKITFRIDGERMDELERCAVYEGMPVSFIVRHLVIRFLEDRRRMPLQYLHINGLKDKR